MTKALTLRSGATMPAVGLGTWKVPKEATSDAVFEAIKMGYRHLDCASIYDNEVEVGQGIRRAIDEGLVKREDLFVVSKLWCTFHAKEHVPIAIARTLADLGLDYLDLYLIHFPIPLKYVDPAVRYPPGWVYDPKAEKPSLVYSWVPMHETWAAMEELHKAGTVKHLGVCNFKCANLFDLMACASKVEHQPEVLQIERHVYLQEPRLVRMANELGIVVVDYSPLGSSSYVEMGSASMEESPLHEPAVLAAADAHNVSPGQVLLRWGIQSGCGVIPKSSKVARIKENLDLFSFVLTPNEMAELAVLDKNKRFNDPGDFPPSMNSFCPIFD